MEDRNLELLEPAPRKVPLPLALKILFGGDMLIAAFFPTVLLAFVVPYILKNGFANFVPVILTPAFPVVYILLLVKAVKRVLLLKYGDIRFAVLSGQEKVDRRNDDMGPHTTFNMTFDYEYKGKMFSINAIVSSPKRLVDDAREPVILDPARPEKAELLDILPAEVYVERSGKLACKRPGLGYVYLAVSVILFTSAAYFGFFYH
jgi:hypothetical protein